MATSAAKRAKKPSKPSPQKNCVDFVFCRGTLWEKSKFSKCKNCRGARKRYAERPIDWCVEEIRKTRLREIRLTPFAGQKVVDIPKIKIASREKGD